MSEKSHNLYALFESRFPADRTEIALETDTGATFSFADLHGQSAQAAMALTALGVQSGDRVAVQAPKSAMALFLYLGCLRAGAIYLPMNTAYTAKEVDYLLRDAEPVVFVSDPGNQAVMDVAEKAQVRHVLTLDVAGRGTLADAVEGAPSSFETVTSAADDIAAILYTSGTTGQPKGAMLSHDNLASNALTLHKAWGFAPGDVLLHSLPIFHAHGLFVALPCALLNGSKQIFMPGFNARDVVERLPRATVFMGVPTHYVRLLGETDFDRTCTANMRLFVSGSAPLMEDTFREFETRTGHTILERYGMTETVMNTSNPYEGARVPGSVGPPLPGIRVRVCAEDGAELAQGDTGVLEVKGPNVFKGYWRNPEKTQSEFRDDGFFITGDLSRIDENGYVHIVGRAKDLIISGGYNVYPKEVETALLELSAVSDAAVIGVPHTDFGEGVTAVVVADGAGVIDEADLIAALKKDLASYKVPKRVIEVDEIPRNTMGKVQKNALREAYKDLYL